MDNFANPAERIHFGMKIKNKKTILTIISVLEVIALLIFATYAWIEGNLSPSIAGNNITISSSPGLIMKIQGTQAKEISINDYIGDNGSRFALSEASSQNGRDVFFRDTSKPVLLNGDKEIIFLREATDADVYTSYIVFSFTLQADGGDRNVYFDPNNCYIKENEVSMNAVRVSFTWTENEQENIVICGMKQGINSTLAVTGINNEDSTGYYDYQIVRSFADFNNATPLFHLDQDEERAVTIKIWLEGCDEECTNAIAGSAFDMQLFFDTNS